MPINVAKTFPGLCYWMRLPGFTAFCGVSAGICAARVTLEYWQPDTSLPALYVNALILLSIFFALGGILCKRPVWRAALFAVSGTVLFTGNELGLRGLYREMEALSERHQILTVQVQITGPVAEQYSSYRFRGKVIDADNADVERILKGKTLQYTSRRPVPPYGTVTIQGSYAAPRPAAGLYGFNQREHFAANNIYGSFFVNSILFGNSGDNSEISNKQPASGKQLPTAEQPSLIEQPLPTTQSPPLPIGSFIDKLFYTLRMRVHNVINQSGNPDARAILHAAFLGEREHLPDNLRVTLRKAGIVHLLVISGFHAALLYSALYVIFGLFGLPSKFRTLISLAALWGYLFFIGFIPPLFRATVMTSFFCLSMMSQRKNHGVHSLGIAGFLWLYISPHSLFVLGFQLSFAATAGIIILQPVLGALTHAINSKVRNKPAEFLIGKALSPVWVSIAVTAATAPPLLYHFGAMSLYGILYNTIAIPLMSAAMWCFFAAIVSSPIPPLSATTVWCSEKMLELMIYLSTFSERIAISEVVIPDITGLQIVVMVIFIIGLCGIRKKLRGVYTLRAGGAALLIFAMTVLYGSMQIKTEKMEFTRGNSTVSVIIHEDNNAWIIAQGKRNDIRLLRTREVETLLYRRKIRGVPLFIINEEAEREAHEFAFNTGFNPKIVVLRNISVNDRTAERRIDDGYTRIDGRIFVNLKGTCSLKVETLGRIGVIGVR